MFLLRGQFCRIAVIALMLVSLTAVIPGAASAGPGNSDAAHACQKGGWTTLQGTDGVIRFSNQGECVSYAAHGGELETIPVRTIGFSFVTSGAEGNCNIWVELVNFTPLSEYSVVLFWNGGDPETRTMKTDTHGYSSGYPFDHHTNGGGSVQAFSDGVSSDLVAVAC